VPRSLKNTKNQEFLARPTEIKLGDSGEVWQGVIMTNPKNRNENDVGFSWNSRTQRSKQRIFGRSLCFVPSSSTLSLFILPHCALSFYRSHTASSDSANDSDHEDR
jgi:hypothetical protein